ncbi:MAG TPA: chloride channel protein [Anaerolineae bacterium]
MDTPKAPLTSKTRWLDHLHVSDTAMMAGAAILVGITGAAGVWLFKRLIDLAHIVAFDGIGATISHLGTWLVFLVPVLGGIVVGLIQHFFVGEERHHGVAGIMEAVALAGGRLQYQRIPAKTLASAIAIGSGASIGPEDPSVQIGSNIGSMIGQIARLSDDRVRTVVAAGAAAGIAAAFNAPIAGVFFALEVILGELSASSLGSVTLAAVISAVVTQAVSGTQPAFHVPSYAFNGAQELPFYLVLGLITGPIAALYIFMLDRTGAAFHKIAIPGWLKPVLGGLVVGVVGLFLPQLFGVGYETIGAVLNGESMAFGVVLALLIGKLVLTPVSIGSGFPGGVFAPSLFIGAMVGEAFGQVAATAFPQMGITPAAFAMVGMAAVLAGAVHTPLTAIILLFEMTNDYRIILPLMFAVTISIVIAQRLQHESVYTMALARKGVRLEHGRDVELLEGIRVDEVMETSPAVLHATDPLEQATEWLLQTRHHGVAVLDAREQLCGILTLQDIERVRQQDAALPAGMTVMDCCTQEVVTAYPDESIGAAMRRMSLRDIGRLPVVARNAPRTLVGLLRRADMVRAYDVALTRRAELRHRTQQVRLGAYSGAKVQEITVQPDALCAGKRVSEMVWPKNSVIASVRRGRDIIVPRGDTVLNAGDVLAVVANDDALEMLRELCG